MDKNGVRGDENGNPIKLKYTFIGDVSHAKYE